MNSIEKTWRKFLEKIITYGETHEKDDGDNLLESMINHAFIPNVLNDYGNQNISTDLFLDMIKNGVFNIEGYPMKDIALYDYVTSLDNQEIIENKDGRTGEDKFTYTYPQRIFHLEEANSDWILNQFGIVTSRLSNNSGSNRAVANIYSGHLDCYMKDIPCLNWFQCTIRNNKLILHVMFRSNDCYGAFPSNMLFLNYLGLKITDYLTPVYPNLKFDGINYNSTSLHIYRGDLEQARKVVGL